MNRTTSLTTNIISNMSPSITNTNSKPNSQFKHTILWNNIINDLKKNLLEDLTSTSSTRTASARSASCSSASNQRSNHCATTQLNSHQSQQQTQATTTRIRRQHSRFLAAGVGGMLLIKQNLMSNNTNNSIEDVCFTGSKCVDIVYDFLTSKEQSHSFECQITREKVTKLCQTLMDSGVFESISKNCNKFDDTILKVYRFKQQKETSPQKPPKIVEEKEKISTHFDTKSSNKENTVKDMNIAFASALVFNRNEPSSKILATKPTKSTSTKLKRKLISMKRSSTVQTLLPIETLSKNKCEPPKEANEIDKKNKKIVANQIKKELVIEKLLSIIDLPVIENLLSIDELNGTEQIKDENHNNLKTRSNFATRSKSVSLLEPLSSLKILHQTYDLTKSDDKEEWRKSAIECLQFLEWEKPWHKIQLEQVNLEQESKTNGKYSLVTALYNPMMPQRMRTIPKLNSMSDIELYNLIKEYYKSVDYLNRNTFLDDSFQPLFAQILLFLRQTHYNKALDVLNLGTLLLNEETQAEFKRLLKFLYLTANTSIAPRLSEKKPNNSILLNHFAGCLFNTKLVGYEESRLILNFMLNNFDDLFKVNKSIEESLSKRCDLLKKYGHEEALLEKLYCKQISSKEFDVKTKEETTKALVDLINHIVDDPQISLKQKKLKLRALQRIHPDIYEKHFSDLQF